MRIPEWAKVVLGILWYAWWFCVGGALGILFLMLIVVLLALMVIF